MNQASYSPKTDFRGTFCAPGDAVIALDWYSSYWFRAKLCKEQFLYKKVFPKSRIKRVIPPKLIFVALFVPQGTLTGANNVPHAFRMFSRIPQTNVRSRNSRSTLLFAVKYRGRFSFSLQLSLIRKNFPPQVRPNFRRQRPETRREHLRLSYIRPCRGKIERADRYSVVKNVFLLPTFLSTC